MAKGRVLGVGYPTLDHVWCASASVKGGKARVRSHLRQPGGQVPTALVALRRWGVPASYLGPLGDDEGGRLQNASLRDEGVQVLGAVCPGVESQQSFIAVDDASGERTIHWYRDDRLALGSDVFEEEMLDGVAAVLLDGDEVELALAVATAARRRDLPVMVDIDEPSTRTAELLAVTTHAIFSGDFAQRYSGESDLDAALAEVGSGGPAVVVATLGSAGAVLWSDGAVERRPSPPVEAVDTTSAGDVFHAAFLYGELVGWPVAKTLGWACAAGALTCTALGGRASIPQLAAINELAL